VQHARDLLVDTTLALPLLAAVSAGLLIGIERGWRQRAQAAGTRVAGVRTFTLIGGSGGLVAVVAREVSPLIAAVVAAGITGGLLVAFLRHPARHDLRDATTMITALATFLLGVLAGAGQPAFAVAGAALVTLVLATREQSHRLLRSLSAEDIHAIAQFAVISVAVLPFLPDRPMGPYDAWNPFQLWLVVVLISGFSIAGYVADRVVGKTKGTITTALIGGAYSSTAVTAAMATRLRDGEPGPLTTGIALASAVMYVRVWVLTAVLAPRVALPMFIILAPAGAVAWLAAGIAWRSEASVEGSQHPPGKPFRLLPAFGFLLAVAGAALLVRWAQAQAGEAGGAWSLFLAGSFDVDTAIVTLAGLPANAIGPGLAALALGGTAAMNMSFKIGVAAANAGWPAGRRAVVALSASTIMLAATLAWRAFTLWN
jgi:uncharacterized membrane protein (DUF4010 family)